MFNLITGSDLLALILDNENELKEVHLIENKIKRMLMNADDNHNEAISNYIRLADRKHPKYSVLWSRLEELRVDLILARALEKTNEDLAAVETQIHYYEKWRQV